jgi:DNA-binding response OmpR family regulator
MSKKKILIVDDDQDIRRALNVRLRANGYDTSFAGDAYTAITMTQKEQPDLILLDLGLPAGGGYSVMQRLQEIPALACIPVIVVSARARRTDEATSLEAGAVAYMQKPVTNDQLLSAIQQALGGATGAEQENF